MSQEIFACFQDVFIRLILKQEILYWRKNIYHISIVRKFVVSDTLTPPDFADGLATDSIDTVKLGDKDSS